MTTTDGPDGVLADVGLVIVAAGSGTRLGAAMPKAFVPLAGRTLLEHALGRLAGHVAHLVVVAPSDHIEPARLAAEAHRGDAVVVPGGATRSASVAAGLAALPHVPVVAVHDAARPLVDVGALLRAVEAVRAGADAAAPAIPVVDTLKEVDPVTEEVRCTLDRRALRAVQTPQVFRREGLARAHQEGAEASDDLALVERLGGRVVLVEGSPRYMKVTVPEDLLLTAALEACA